MDLADAMQTYRCWKAFLEVPGKASLKEKEIESVQALVAIGDELMRLKHESRKNKDTA